MSAHLPPVLFIHGLVGHMRVEAPIQQPLLAPDLLGYGRQRAWSGEASLHAQAEFLRDLVVREFHGEPTVLAGHSIGGAIALIFARLYPQFVHSIVNVEGNFTLKDAFWSASIARMSEQEITAGLEADRAAPDAWLKQSGVVPTPDRIKAARSHLAHQDARTMQSMARSVVGVTGAPAYLDDVRAVLESGVPFHLVAGERSREGWDVPAFVLDRAASFTLIPDCGHLVTIEQPQAFAAAVRDLRSRARG